MPGPIELSMQKAIQAALDNPPPAQVRQKDEGIGPFPYLVSAGGDVADLVTTLQAVNSGRGQEANPLFGRSPGRIAATKAASTIGTLFLLKLLEKNHPTAAKWLGYGNGIGKGLIAVHSSQVGK